MKVFQRIEGAPNLRVLGGCEVDLPLKRHLVVMQGDQFVALYRFAVMTDGSPCVILDVGQSPEHLPGFFTVAEWAQEMQHGQPAPQHA